MNKNKILIMGLPGAGKTTLANELKQFSMFNEERFHWNGDEVRANITSHLGFSLEDRIQQAKTISWLCDKIVANGCIAIADFICPTKETQQFFDDAFIVWMDRVSSSRFEDTNKIFQPPTRFNVRIGVEHYKMAPHELAKIVKDAWDQLPEYWQTIR